MGKSVNIIVVNFIGVLFVLSAIHTASGLPSIVRAAKCIILNRPDHATGAALLQQCLPEYYGKDNETACYDELGCFPMYDPCTSLLRPFPSPLHPAEINVQIYCYTRESPERFNVTLWPEINLEGCNFKPYHKTAFIVHGFANNGNSSWVSDLKDNYLAVRDVNMFLVDWGKGAELLNYLQVASNTRIVGAEVARFVKWLIEHKGLTSSDVHLMGHSLGAHICSFVGQEVPGIARLTAMDPAQPGFEGAAKECRLDKDDANYVEVLHTNAAPFIPFLGFGFMSPCGHVDIYLNGGLRQPGCNLPKLGEITGIWDLITFSVEFINMLVSCSHSRSYRYFTATLRKDCVIWCRLTGATRQIINGLTLGYMESLFSKLQKCNAASCLPLGIDTPNYKARGVFIATTNKDYPYCETDPEENSRMFREIEESLAEGSTKVEDGEIGVTDAVKEGTDTVVEMVSLAADKGTETFVKVLDAILGK